MKQKLTKDEIKERLLNTILYSMNNVLGGKTTMQYAQFSITIDRLEDLRTKSQIYAIDLYDARRDEHEDIRHWHFDTIVGLLHDYADPEYMPKVNLAPAFEPER